MKKIGFMGLIFYAIAANGYASESDGIYALKVGQYEVYIMVESERDGNTGILVGADEAVLGRYIPAEGFKHTANAVLIKAPKQNILIDTGTGAGGIIIEKIKKLGVQPENVDAVLLTHLHGDHFGSLQKDGAAVFTKAKVYISAKELEFFTKTNVNQGAVAALAPYGSKVITFEPGELGKKLKEIVPGISPIAAYGHTPGHTLYLLENKKEKLLIVGDLLHIALVQFPVPEISATYDMDQKAAGAVRRQVLDYAAKNKIAIAGMHIVYPGTGSVSAEGSGFKFSPNK
ncbi:MAG: MBL fold metallo-hydrolase [Treponema sp.]|jgi:glyoxylase-like metal-dependent hydrolase (beta-lactamase superfamily II)|nr:MBL fold metallo-hydrolase [Treponema sp.]